MAPAFSKFTPRNVAGGAATVALLYWIVKHQNNNGNTKRLSENKEGSVPKKTLNGNKLPRKEKIQVDMHFFRQLFRILKVLVPGWFTKEVMYLLTVAGCLVTRTFCDIWMISNGTSIESAIIGRDVKLFKKHLLAFALAMPLVSIVNNTLKYGLNELTLRFRTRLSNHLYNQYMRGFTFYQMSNLDTRIANADQILTQDVDKFCHCVTDLYSNINKPLLDIIIYVHGLTKAIGAQGPLYMMMYLVASGTLLTYIRRPVGRLTVVEQKLEGEYRYVNSRLIANSEEIAFYNGNEREKQTVRSTFGKLVSHVRKFIQFKFCMGILDNVIAKYIATVVGYYVVSRPFLVPNAAMTNSTYKERLEDYYKSGRMLVKLAEAIGRLVLAGRDLTRLAGFTSRVTELVDVLDDLNRGRYQRSMIADQHRTGQGENSERPALVPGSGKIVIQDNIIKFDKVPLVTPNGDILVNQLNFEVQSGMNVLVCGPNGCGKSSLFRILGELWPLFGGTLTKPEKGKLFYVPQRPYMTLGSLRDQIIYPDSKEDMRKKGITDSVLVGYLDIVQLSYILEREGGWNTVQDWIDVLSGGEKQRVAMARLFYHRPQFAILDECTSAVSVDVEGSMYQYCRQVGITLFTVSHRKSLWKHHEFYLQMDGRGLFEFKPIEADTEEFGS